MILSEVPRLEGRNGEVYRSVIIKGWTEERAAEHFGISQQRVNQIIAAVRATLPPADRAALVEESTELIRDLRRTAWEIIDAAPAPVFVGKDGTMAYDASGKPVQDHTGRLRAMDFALKCDEALAKRLGLDAATKIESTATVRYEIAGLEDGTLS